MKIIFQVNGGIGKSIAATAVCKAIKTQYPNDELVVITGYPEVFMQNPYVDEALAFNNLNYFYPHYIEGKSSRLLLHDPYQENDFVYQRGHLVKVWCEMFGIKYNGEQPEIFLTGNDKSVYGQMFTAPVPKPIFVIQTNGGAPKQVNQYSWPRDLPLATAQKIVDAFAGDYNVVHIRRQDQPALQNTFPVHADFRPLAVLIAMSDKRLFIDSFAQHTAAALGKPSVVVWIANVPTQFGYAMHHNIIANPPTRKPELRNAVFSKYNIMDQVMEFPYNNEEEIFDADKIIAALKNEKKQDPVKPETAKTQEPAKPKDNKTILETIQQNGNGLKHSTV